MIKFPLFRLILAVLILIGAVYILQPYMKMFSFIDYIEYWSAARLTTMGSNPYGVQENLELQESIGWPDEKGSVEVVSGTPWIMLNPPWTIAYVLPLGLVDYDTSRTIFFLLSIFLFVLSSAWLWEALGGSQNQIWLAWLVTFSFGPTLQIIRLGQVTILMLFGCALFLRMAQREQWFWAGVAASTILIKPHTLLIFGGTLFLWVLYNRRWLVFLGAISSITITSLIVLAFNPQVFSHFFTRWQQDSPVEWLTATPGSMLRIIFGWEFTWLQYIPVLIGFAWLIWYWYRNKDNWQWKRTLPLLALASTATAAYGWVADTIVVLPALLAAAISIMSVHSDVAQRKKINPLLIVAAYGVVNYLVLFPRWASHDYWWFASVLWILCNFLKFIVRDQFSSPHVSVNVP